MASISSIRAALSSAIASVSGVNCYPEAPGSIEPPAAVIENDTGGDLATLSSVTQYRFRLVILVSLGPGHVAAQQQLDGFLAATGSGSILAAIGSDTTLSGTCSTSETGTYTYNAQEYGGTDYLAATVPVDVWTVD